MAFFEKFKKQIVTFSLLSVVFLGVSYTPDYFEISKNLDIFYSVYKELNVGYVDETKPGQLMKTGIDAMLASLDPYTVYYTENDIEDYRYMTTGEYGGIGATVNDINGKIIIAEPYEGFSAFKAGLRAGDQIVGVNDVNVTGKKSDDIGMLLKGQAGTALKLKVIKAGQNSVTELNFKREEIKTKAVPYYGILPNGETGYIKLSSFTENCSGEVKDALNDLKLKSCKNLVLDLRGNLGGLLIEAVNIVNLFTDKGQEVVFTKGKITEWDKSYQTVYNPIDTKIPLVVLVDENSASASEIVCGALQDLDRAVIVGKRTYGKGLVQQTKDLVYNAKIKFTVAKYYIPSGRCVQALDYTNKDKDGRVEKVPDSLITAFKTKSGRIVYDGAGIMPDVITKESTDNAILFALMSKFHIFNYATEFVLKHPTISSTKDFVLSESDYLEFMNYLKDKDYSYKSKSELDLDNFLKNTEEENHLDVVKKEFDALKAKIAADKKDDLTEHKSDIIKLLSEEIISRYYFQKGRIEFSLKVDEDLNQAINLFSTSNKIENILSSKGTPNRPFNSNKKF